MTDHDMETGEVYSNGARASAIASSARMQMQDRRLNVGENILHDAVARAISKMPIWITAEKTGNRAKYAPLKDILQIVRPPLAEFGVRIRQGAERSFGADEGGGVKGRLVPVYTDLIHVTSGAVDRTTIEIPLTRLDPQAMGSAITYGRRYTLLAALGLASDDAADDDGQRSQAVDITEKAPASKAYDDLIAEMKAAKSLDAVNKFVTDAKTRRRINDLSEGEQERLRAAYSDIREALGKE